MEEKRIVLGYDLSEGYAQISYFVLGQEKPETFAFSSDGEKYNVPLCLCKRRAVNQWYYGAEAIQMFRAGEGVLVEDLLWKAVSGDVITIKEDGSTEKKEFDPVQLLGLFIKKSFSQMGFLLGEYQIERLMFTVDNLDERMLEVLREAVKLLNLEQDKISFSSHIESMYYYIINQPKELWSYQVGVFDFTMQQLKSYRVEMNRKTKPIVTMIHPKIHNNIKKPDSGLSIMERDHYYEQLDVNFLDLLSHYVEGNIMTSIYLIGDGFDGEWYRESLKFLCKSRRVFGGNNLYSKGACLAAREKVEPTKEAAAYIYLGKDKLKSNVGIEVINGMETVYQPLLDAGINWYEGKASIELMLMSGDTVPFLITPMSGEKSHTHEMKLDGYEERPSGTIRIRIDVMMKSDHDMCARISDLGFGDYYPIRDDIWEETFSLL